MPPYTHTLTQRLFGQPSDLVQLNPGHGPQFGLVSRPGGHVTLVEQQVFTAGMNIARTGLDRAYGIITMRIAGTPAGAGIVPANFDHLLQYCFRPGAVVATIQATMATVRNNLQRIRLGLWSPQLQIIDSNPNRGGVASGYVRCSYSELFRMRDAAREQSFAGRIHIRFATYNAANTPANQRGAGMTMVHEGAHKFCGCRDWLYNGGGFGAYAGMIALGLAPAIPALTNAQGLNNADSYAEFVLNL
ncbi:MAG: hypothetical protein NTV70_21460 [Acidobacteria bacterium]|nr:hypothetical protein [Acidobacteriota bacterium]